MSATILSSYGSHETIHTTPIATRSLGLNAPSSATPFAHPNIHQSVIHPTPSCSNPPNIVDLAIHTTVTISDFDRFYSTPIYSFQPSYQALPDGSLITPAFVHDGRGTVAWAAVLGGLIMFFIRNCLVSAGFIERVKIKKKNLFYALLASQLLGLVGTIPELLSHFQNNPHCTAYANVLLLIIKLT